MGLKKGNSMQVSEMMQYSVLTTTPDSTLALAWRLLEDHRIRHLPVVSEGHLVGLVTDRDIRSAAPASAPLPSRDERTIYMGTTPVSSCMTQDVITVNPETDMTVATQRMLNGRFGCLPVLAQHRLVGIITEIDLLRGYLTDVVPMAREMAVLDAMQDLLILVTPEDLVSTAYQRMQGGIVRHLPIVDEAEQLVGVITDRDIRQAVAESEVAVVAESLTERLGMRTVNDLMTTDVVTVRSETSLTEAAECFLAHKFGCLPVIREDRTLAGILTVTDVLGLYVAQAGLGGPHL